MSTLPHRFLPGGGGRGNSSFDNIVEGGTYWWLKPNDDSEERGKPWDVFFPVADSVSMDWSHEWSQTQNLVKSQGPTSWSDASGIALYGISNTIRNALGGGGILAATTSIFNDTRAPSLSIQSKIFSPDGSGGLLSTIEMLRNCSHGMERDNPITDNKAVEGILKQVGGTVNFINHPTLWDVKLITLSGMVQGTKNPLSNAASTVGHWTDMYISRLQVELFSPWIGLDPSYATINISMSHALPGINTSTHIGVGPDASSRVDSGLGGGGGDGLQQAMEAVGLS